MSAASELDHAVFELGEGQHGNVTGEQLRAIGLTRHAIAHRIRAARLHRVHHDVFAVGRPPHLPVEWWHAAVLACGPTALLSHRSAAYLWDLAATSQSRVDVTVPGTSRRRQNGIRLHRTRVLADADTAVVDGIPVTSVARTLVDLAGPLSSPALLRAVEQADRIQQLDVPAVLAAMERVRGRRYLFKLQRILAAYDRPPPVRSKFERDMVQVVQTAGLPPPLVNSDAAGFEVDIFWPSWQLVVELDSRDWHSDPRTFESDRIKDAGLQKAGYRVLRVTYERLHAAPSSVLEDVRALAALASQPAWQPERPV